MNAACTQMAIQIEIKSAAEHRFSSIGRMTNFHNDEALEQAQRAAAAAEWTAIFTAVLAFVTVLLVIGAVLAAVYAKRTWQATQGELELARTLARRLEASGVTAWLLASRGDELSVRFRNSNPGAVYDMRIVITGRFVANSGDVATKKLVEESYGAMSPSKDSIRHDADELTTIARARYMRDDAPVFLPGTQYDWKPWSGLEGETGLSVEITFRDSAGIYWRRDSRGVLTELNDKTVMAKE